MASTSNHPRPMIYISDQRIRTDNMLKRFLLSRILLEGGGSAVAILKQSEICEGAYNQGTYNFACCYIRFSQSPYLDARTRFRISVTARGERWGLRKSSNRCRDQRSAGHRMFGRNVRRHHRSGSTSGDILDRERMTNQIGGIPER